MKTLFALILGAFVITLAGCAVSKPMQTKYVAADHAQYKAHGTSSIAGQAFLRQRGGGVVTCAGALVLIFPATPFFNEMVAMGARGETPDAASGIQAAARDVALKTTCDAQGNFEFKKLAAGSWIVSSMVTWSAGYTPNGGQLLKTVDVKEGEAVRVMLTDADFYR